MMCRKLFLRRMISLCSTIDHLKTQVVAEVVIVEIFALSLFYIPMNECWT